MTRTAYLAIATLVAMLILAPAALAQGEDTVPGGDDDPYLPEPDAQEVDERTLERIAGQPMPETGGPVGVSQLVLLAAVLILGPSVAGYAVLRTRLRASEGIVRRALVSVRKAPHDDD